MTDEVDKAVMHAVRECYECNGKLTDIVRHYRQEKCKHNFKKLNKNQKGCLKCLALEKIRK